MLIYLYFLYAKLYQIISIVCIQITVMLTNITEELKQMG